MRVTPEDVQKIAAHLGLSEAGFRSRFLAPGGLLKQGLGNRCVFLAEGRQAGCTIYPVRPERCRTWPFWEENIGSEEALLAAAALCSGIRLDPKPPSGS